MQTNKLSQQKTGNNVLFPDPSSTWNTALFASCFRLIALCWAVAPVMGGCTRQRKGRTFGEKQDGGRLGREAITGVIYVFKVNHAANTEGMKNMNLCKSHIKS